MNILMDHILIVVKDLENSIKFYQHLGFEHIETIKRKEDKVALLELGSIKLELMALIEGKETYRIPRIITDIGFRHIGFRVNDIIEIYTKLKDKIVFDSPPKEIQGRGGRMTVFFKDPNGVELHFVQEP